MPSVITMNDDTATTLAATFLNPERLHQPFLTSPDRVTACTREVAALANLLATLTPGANGSAKPITAHYRANAATWAYSPKSRSVTWTDTMFDEPVLRWWAGYVMVHEWGHDAFTSGYTTTAGANRALFHDLMNGAEDIRMEDRVMRVLPAFRTLADLARDRISAMYVQRLTNDPFAFYPEGDQRDLARAGRPPFAPTLSFLTFVLMDRATGRDLPVPDMLADLADACMPDFRKAVGASTTGGMVPHLWRVYERIRKACERMDAEARDEQDEQGKPDEQGEDPGEGDETTASADDPDEGEGEGADPGTDEDEDEDTSTDPTSTGDEGEDTLTDEGEGDPADADVDPDDPGDFPNDRRGRVDAPREPEHDTDMTDDKDPDYKRHDRRLSERDGHMIDHWRDTADELIANPPDLAVGHLEPPRTPGNESRRMMRAMRRVLADNADGRMLRGRERGRLDVSRVHRVMAGHRDVFRERIANSGTTEWSVVIALDVSLSMYDTIDSGPAAGMRREDVARDLTATLIAGLDRVPGVRVALAPYARSARWACPFGTPSATMQRVAYGAALEGSTNESIAIWWGMDQIRRQRTAGNLIIVLTDGEPTDSGATLEAVREAHEAGILTVGVGLNDPDAPTPLIPAYHPIHAAVDFADATTTVPAMVRRVIANR